MVSAAVAQQPKHAGHKKPDPEKRAKHLTEKMTTQLSLTKEQVPKVYQINFDAAKKMIALKSDTTIEKKAKHERMKAIRNTQKEELKKILTPEQFKKGQEIIEEKKEKMKENKSEKNNNSNPTE